jgi:hypothetical protein
LNKDIAKQLATFERKILRALCGGIKGNKRRKQYNKELVHLFEDSDIHLFVRISRFNWIGHINRMKGKLSILQ